MISEIKNLKPVKFIEQVTFPHVTYCDNYKKVDTIE